MTVTALLAAEDDAAVTTRGVSACRRGSSAPATVKRCALGMNDAKRNMARWTLYAAALVTTWALSHFAYQTLQAVHREHCSRNLLSAVLFGSSDACVYVDRAINAVESAWAYLFRTSVVSAIYGGYSFAAGACVARRNGTVAASAQRARSTTTATKTRAPRCLGRAIREPSGNEGGGGGGGGGGNDAPAAPAC